MSANPPVSAIKITRATGMMVVVEMSKLPVEDRLRDFAEDLGYSDRAGGPCRQNAARQGRKPPNRGAPPPRIDWDHERWKEGDGELDPTHVMIDKVPASAGANEAAKDPH